MKTKSLMLTVLVLILAGCGRSTHDIPVGNVGMLAAPTSHPDTTVETMTRQVKSAPLSDATDICDVIRSVLEGIPGAEVTIPVGEFGARDRVPCKDACRFAVNGTFAGLQGAARPEQRIEKALQDRGFIYDHRLDADGPDGTRFTLRTGARYCRAQGRWDGGDDSDPAYVPGDWYEFIVDCGCDDSGAEE